MQRARDLRHLPPERGKVRLRTCSAAGEPARGEDDRVDRPRRRAADAFVTEPLGFEQAVERAPGESAVGAAALQREIGDAGVGHAGLFRDCECRAY